MWLFGFFDSKYQTEKDNKRGYFKRKVCLLALDCEFNFQTQSVNIRFRDVQKVDCLMGYQNC
jgi:hypothetical protein